MKHLSEGEFLVTQRDKKNPVTIRVARFCGDTGRSKGSWTVGKNETGRDSTAPPTTSNEEGENT